ncbi:MAG: 5-formyltetrahydrofolate cyclo-ligase [Clostridiaceae bacterium]|jgi:5-formyltetrahydrofolate cyclo-ligase|nr:5-formyltetrahydrofolate cyclo-ligase [Clostridiaceae bacterium]
MEDKKILRKKAIEKRDSIKAELILKNSEIITRKLISHPWYIQCSTLFIYVSKDNEVKTHDIINDAINRGKNVCVPRIAGKGNMEAVLIKNPDKDLKLGFFNTYEPEAHLTPVSVKDIDLVIVPGLLFDRKGYRIGYGGGYYDRFLSNVSNNCKTIGLAFSFQIKDRLPIEHYDRNVMLIISERESTGV